MNKTHRIGALLALSIMLLASKTIAAPEHHVYLTAEEDNDVPQAVPMTDFSCSDKIFAVIESKDDEMEEGKISDQFKLLAVWRDPGGEDREQTNYNFKMFNGKSRIWVWLKLNKDSTASLVQFINPSAGMEEFIGEWELRVFINDQLLHKSVFSVLC